MFLQIAQLKSWADELNTRDGKTLYGAVKLLNGDIVQVGETRLPLNNVQRLALDPTLKSRPMRSEKVLTNFGLCAKPVAS